MQIKHLYSLLIGLLIFLFSCSESNIINPVQEKHIDTLKISNAAPQSLKVGNSWIYQVKYYDFNGSLISEFNDTSRIVQSCLGRLKKVNINSDTTEYYYHYFYEYHSAFPLDTITVSCLPNFLREYSLALYRYSSSTKNCNLFEIHQPYPRYLNTLTYYQDIPTCGYGQSQSCFINEFGDSATSYSRQYDVIIFHGPIGVLNIDSCYFSLHDVIAIDSVVKNPDFLTDYPCRFSRYVSEKYYAKNIGLVKFKWYYLKEGYIKILVTETDLISYHIQ